MPTKPQSTTTQAVEAKTKMTIEQELGLLRGFRDLVGERWGYLMGRKLTQEDLTNTTEAERKAVAEARKGITGDNLKQIITKSDIKTYESTLGKIKTARETLNRVAKPFREKMAPLASAVKYIDNVAIPDSLKELGAPIQPRFSLSKWATEAVEQSKKKK